VNGHLHAPNVLPLEGVPPRHLLDRKLGGPQIQSGRGGEEKNSYSCPCQESNAGRPAPRQSIYWLS